MADVFNFPDWIAMTGLRRLTNKLQVAQFGNTTYNKELKKPFAVGDTFRVPLPQKYTIRYGLTYTPQPLSRPVTTVSVQTPFGLDFEWDDFEAAIKMERQQVAETYLNPAMDQISQEIDSQFTQYAYLNTPNIVGVLGTDPTSFQTMNQARQRMVELAGWNGGKDRGMIIPPSVNTSLVNAAISYFNPASEISQQYKDGSIGRAMGFDWYESMSLYTHTAGTAANGTFAVTTSSANQIGNSLAVTCQNGDVFNQGDVIAVGTQGSTGMYAVNPMTRRRTTTATLKQFVITQTTTATTTTATLPIYPAIFGPGSQYQNVDQLCANGATVTVFPGTSSPSGKSGINGLAMTTDAFALVGVAMGAPENQQISKEQRDPETGLAVRFVRAWDPVQSKMINRFDCAIGFGTLYAENAAVRILCA